MKNTSRRDFLKLAGLGLAGRRSFQGLEKRQKLLPAVWISPSPTFYS